METNASDVELITSETLYSGFNRLRRFFFRFLRYDGTWSQVIDREMLERRNASIVLPYDPRHDRVILIEQFRFVATIAGMPARQLETIGGLVEAGSSPEETARREAEEEAGLAVGELIPIGRFMPSPGCLSEVVYAYCCLMDTERLAAAPHNPDEEEDIRLHVLEFTEVERRLVAGEFGYMATALSVQWLVANRERLRTGAAISPL